MTAISVEMEETTSAKCFLVTAIHFKCAAVLIAVIL